ncbi:MAG: outer membrane protein transport protein [Gammaproteobacteria bacterium]
MGSKIIRIIPFIILAFLPVKSVLATNGLNLLGFGTESMAMAGADIAVARDTFALNINPAGLAQIEHSRLDQYAAVAYAFDYSHNDAFNENTKTSNKHAYLADLGYVKRFSKSLTAGFGLFAQGGAGNKFRNLNTAFGTRDDLGVTFAIARIIPGLAYAVNDKLSLGLSLLLTRSTLEQEVFPDTSFTDPGNTLPPFFGFHLKDASTLRPGIKAGVMYKPGKSLTLGLTYTSKVTLKLKDGHANVNLSAIGLDKVRYRNASASGIDQPEELGIGAAWQVTNKLLLAAELNWINWSDAVKRSSLKLKDPDNATAPPVLEQSMNLNWRDQYVVALGAAYDWNDRLTLRGGFNYGRNPVPANTINPLLAAIAKYHITTGLSYQLTPHWKAGTALEYQLKTSQNYTNQQLPFGAKSKETLHMMSLHFMVSYIW